mmetsp:Transcript_27382/g.33563  ORF Transcript_27382/g.33563 Transcript_27382/m.33563 type:complete len:91 (-) Transcript_27382:540-812(-)
MNADEYSYNIDLLLPSPDEYLFAHDMLIFDKFKTKSNRWGRVIYICNIIPIVLVLMNIISDLFDLTISIVTGILWSMHTFMAKRMGFASR